MNLDFQAILVSYMALLFSICLHECAHAWMADMCGDDTARLMGRVSLNPAVHIDPVGSVVFPLLAMITGAPLLGWAKPVPVNPGRLRNYRRDDILVSLAGVASNLLLALFAVAALRVLSHVEGVGFNHPLPQILRPLLQINVILLVFNLIPIPPLDGSHVLHHFLPMGTAWQFHMLSQYGFLILMVLLISGILSWIIFPPLLFFMRMAGPLGLGF
jgi:Zn-dependent protease